jgi:hypothetical protein
LRLPRLPRFLADHLLRQKLRMEHTPLDAFRVRLARTADDYEGVFRLVQATYVATGIADVLESTLRITPQHVLPEAYVLMAHEGERLVGTMTVTLDSPALLPLDKDYPDELDALRAAGGRLCELGSLAIVERCRHRGVMNLLSMAAFTLATSKLEASHVVIGVNPRAFDHFRATYQFAHLGQAKRHAQLVAPVVGLVTDLGTLQAFLRRVYPTPLATGTQVADHFFGAALPCIDLPAGAHGELARWKLSREVFREVFLRRSNHLETLDARTQEYLERARTPTTLGRLAFPLVPRAAQRSALGLSRGKGGR